MKGLSELSCGLEASEDGREGTGLRWLGKGVELVLFVVELLVAVSFSSVTPVRYLLPSSVTSVQFTPVFFYPRSS